MVLALSAKGNKEEVPLTAWIEYWRLLAAAVPAYVNDHLHGGGKAFLFVRSVGTLIFPQVEQRRLVALDSADTLNAVRAANRQVNSSWGAFLVLV